MKKQALLLLFVLFFFDAVAQDLKQIGNGIKGSVDFDGDGKKEYEGEVKIDLGKLPIPNGNTRDDRDRSSSSSSGNTYSGPEFIGSWGGNLRNSDVAYYITERNTLRWEKDNTEAISILQELNDQLSSDCIDINQLQSIYVRFKRLSSNQRSVLGYEGDEALAELAARLNNARPDYDKYSRMALDIKNNSFSKVDKDVMQKPYEELNGYLRQFLSKDEFDRAKIEYGKHEKDETVKKVYEKARRHEMLKKNNNTRGANNHLTLQKIRKKKNHYNLSNNTINNMSVNGTAISREWEEASTEVMGKTMEKFFEPLKEHTYNIGSGFKGLTKRLVNFSETYSSNVFDLWDADKKAMQALARGENPEPYLIKGQHKVIDNTYRGTINSF